MAGQLKHAMVTYTESGGMGDPIFDTKQAIVVMVKSNRSGYLPDLQEEAVKTVLMQPELLCANWA